MTEEARNMGISASGNITIYPDGPVTLSAGQSYVSYDEWGIQLNVVSQRFSGQFKE